MFGELVGGVGCVRGKVKKCMGCFLDDLRALLSLPTSGQLQPRTRGNGPKRRNELWDVS